VMPPGSSFIVGLTGAPMSIKVGNVLAKLPHVVTVAPVVTHVSTQGTIEVIAGIDLNTYEKLSGPFEYVAGGPFQGPDDCLVDDLFARAKHVRVGDKIEILNRLFRVAGIVEPGKGARKFLQIGVLQDLIGAESKASLFYLKLDNPTNADEVVAEIKAVPGMQEYVATSMSYYLSMMTTSRYPGVSQFITFVIAISVIIGFLVIFQSMYTAVMERTREIGILKALGASKLYIVDVILRETVLLAVGGIVVGVLFSLVARTGIDHHSTLRVVVTGNWILNATAIAIVGSVVGALYPAYKAAQKDPIDALAYE
jgi:putative ABC transport system permease protein